MAALAIALAAIGAAADPPAPLPAVKVWAPSGERQMLSAPLRIAIGSADPDDRFAAQLLVEEARLLGAAAGLEETGAPQIRIGRPGQPVIDRELARAGLVRSVPEQPESYLLRIDSTGVLIAARSAAGVFYAAQTLRQLMRPERGGISLPAGTIRDWPEMAWRGLSVDAAQGILPTESQMERIIATAAEYKLNVVSFYMQHLVAFQASPLIAPKSAELDPAAIRRLVAFAARHHVTLLPQQQTFGHLHHLLRHELYTGLGEVPHGTTLTAGDPAVYRWIGSVIDELTALFPGAWFHAGGDETWDLGKGVNREAVEAQGQTGLWAEHMTRVAETLRARGRRTLFWGDIALKNPALLDRLPKDMIAATWTYEPDSRFADYIAPFRKTGLDVIVCPSVNNWSKAAPDFEKAVPNIGGFVAEGRRQGAMGMLNTVWFDDGESLFDTVWYGVVYSAAAAWTGGDVARDSFDASYDWAFHRAPGTAIAGAIRKLGQVHPEMRAAGLGDAANEYLWMDPYSDRGSRIYARIEPHARRIRLLSEEALIALVATRKDCRLHCDTLDALEFGARRFDWLGMKAIVSAEIQARYRAAWQNQQDTRRANYELLNISDINGLVQDLRNEAGEMKEEYRRLWLSVNRPYLLNSMLGLYDRELQYWLDKAARLADIRANYRTRRTLPDPAAAGLEFAGDPPPKRIQ